MSPITERYSAMDDMHPTAADLGLDAFPAPWTHDGKGWIKDANGVVVVDVFFRSNPRHRTQLMALILAVPDMLTEMASVLDHLRAERKQLFEFVSDSENVIDDEDDRDHVARSDARIERVQSLIHRAKGVL